MKADGPQLYLKCDHCHTFFEYNGGKRKRFCSDAHKMAAWRASAAEDPAADGPVDPRSIAMITGSHVCTDDMIRAWPASGPCPHCERSPV